MATVLGIGGVFFRSRDPSALAEWYGRWLNLPIDRSHTASFRPDALANRTQTVWAPTNLNVGPFPPPGLEFMLDLVVDDLLGALQQIRRGGARQVGGVEEYPYGRFAWFLDPEGNGVELWEPRSASPVGEADRPDAGSPLAGRLHP